MHTFFHARDLKRNLSPTAAPGGRHGGRVLCFLLEVTAESLYEAVAQGLAALRGWEWVAGITHGTVKVSVADVRVEHEVKMTEFTKWLDRPSGSPREMIQRQKVRSILGYASHVRVNVSFEETLI